MALVTVFLTSYNHEKYLKEAIDSVLNQTFQDFELFISDDGSSDGSWDIINSYDDPRIIKFRHEKNLGLQLVDTVDRLKGKYIAIHHSDDMWELDKLAKQVAFMEEHTEYAGCFTKVRYIDENSQEYILPEGHCYKDVFEQKNRTKAQWLHQFFYNGNCLCHPSLLIRRDAYDNYKLLDGVYGLTQLPDFYMWVKLCLHQNIYVYQESLTKFRLRRTKQTNTSADRPDVHIRSQYEYRKVIELYRNINSRELFLEVFPDAMKYIVEGCLNMDYAFAMLLLQTDVPANKLLAMDILYDILNDSKTADELRRLYAFDHNSFKQITAECDVFDVSRYLHILNTQLYVDVGNGIDGQNVINQRVYISADNRFYAEYDLSDFGCICGLRFDPADTYIAMKISSIFADGRPLESIPCTKYFIDNDIDEFSTNDPQYIIKVDNNHVKQIQITGYVESVGEETLRQINKKLLGYREELQTIKESLGWKLLCRVNELRI